MKNPPSLSIEKITQRFYQRFKEEHAAFLRSTNIADPHINAEHYVSTLLNRLMFIYFIQKRGFLDNDPNYLRSRLEMIQTRQGPDHFLSFYRRFLVRLFHDGIGASERTVDLDNLLGDVPYINSGLFDRHELERENPQIDIPDQAFERIFDFFDTFDWILDNRPLRNDSEINPDVLGYVFEQYINKKQMGAYYTEEDITAYISKNTILPFLFDQVAQQLPDAFRANGPIWSLLQRNSDRYIYPEVRKGVDQPLPSHIAAGILDLSRREQWNQPAASPFALPSETWREHIARRTRCQDLQKLLASGTVVSFNDCITHNLDIEQLTQDIIEHCDDPHLLLTLYRTIERITVLDPTCGSGAFLFAALKVLEPRYTACLQRMETFISQHNTESDAAFRDILADIHKHPNQTYFILKSIVINNLFGVDIMQEAVEICKLRLFLTLIAAVDRREDIEPLPDIDFNIRSGNALIGFASYDALQKAIQGDQQRQIDFDDQMSHFSQQAIQTETAFQKFRTMQMKNSLDASQLTDAKRALHDQLESFSSDLSRYLAASYGVSGDTGVNQWQESHHPFHWFSTFYGILEAGGFDVIIGNPPYLSYSKVRSDYRIQGYQTEQSGNLYAFVVERSLALLRDGGRCGMILPIASVSTDGMSKLQQLYDQPLQWHSHYAVRPGKLFAGVDMNLTISLFCKMTASHGRGYTTGYRRWSNRVQGDRANLFPTLTYIPNPQFTTHTNPFPKLGSSIEVAILQRMLAHERKLDQYATNEGTTLFYHSGGRYWRKALLNKLSSHYKPFTVSEQIVPIVLALLNSQLFYWYWICNSNCMDVVSREVYGMPVFPLETADRVVFDNLTKQLFEEYRINSAVRQRNGTRIQVAELNVDVRHAKPIIDDIDRTLADYYEFTVEERDFILNYDIKYRIQTISQTADDTQRGP
ncbi:MAG: DNA methyltransferase [Chloroflexota bacterium]